MDGIRPRTLNRPIELIEPAPAQPNAFGERLSDRTAEIRHPVYASRREVGGGETLADQQEQATSKTVFRIWYRPDVTETWKVWETGPGAAGTTYDIDAIKEIGRREGLEITATRKR